MRASTIPQERGRDKDQAHGTTQNQAQVGLPTAPKAVFHSLRWPLPSTSTQPPSSTSTLIVSATREKRHRSWLTEVGERQQQLVDEGWRIRELRLSHTAARRKLEGEPDFPNFQQAVRLNYSIAYVHHKGKQEYMAQIALDTGIEMAKGSANQKRDHREFHEFRYRVKKQGCLGTGSLLQGQWRDDVRTTMEKFQGKKEGCSKKASIGKEGMRIEVQLDCSARMGKGNNVVIRTGRYGSPGSWNFNRNLTTGDLAMKSSSTSWVMNFTHISLYNIL